MRFPLTALATAINRPTAITRNVWTSSNVHYEQGQTWQNVREYFYFIDHQGMLFLDDARMKNFTSCFKEQKFLQFFFRRVKPNKTGRFEKEFPFVSPCGPEINYVRAEDTPLVFTHLLPPIESGQPQRFGYAHAGERLFEPFDPASVYMFETGRIYHPAPERFGGYGLIRSALAMDMSNRFVYEGADPDRPSHLIWDELKRPLNNRLAECFQHHQRQDGTGSGEPAASN